MPDNNSEPLYMFAPLILLGVALICALAIGISWLANHIGAGIFHAMIDWHVGIS